MARRRIEPFQLALTNLRDRLRTGALAPGVRVTAKEVSETLQLSATPVREALSRLAGEGLLEERRGDGFFVRMLAAADIAGIYRVCALLVADAQGPGRPGRADLAQAILPLIEEDPGRATERLFVAWVSEGGSPALRELFRRLVLQLSPARRLESLVLEALTQEAVGLADLAARPGGTERLAAIAGFYQRRVEVAGRLADLLEARAFDED